MDTCHYDRMEEESSALADERQAVVYPMVTYNPETVESHPQVRGYRVRNVGQRLLRCMFYASLTNAILATICIIFVAIARSMSGSNYEPCLAVCSLVLVGSCLVWCLRYQGEKLSIEGALESVWTTRTFFFCFVSVVVLGICSVIVSGVAIYILERGEGTDCYEAFNKIGNLEINPCNEEAETRYFMSILAVVLLACMGILCLLILGFSWRMSRKFSFKLATEVDSGGVIVTQRDETGQKVIYKLSGKYTDSANVDHHTDTEEQANGQHNIENRVQFMDSKV